MAFKKLDTTLNDDMGRQFGELNRMLAELFTSTAGISGKQDAIDVTSLTVATADANDATTAAALANDIKAKFNTLLTRIGA